MKKGSAALGIVVVILALLILTVFLVSIATRDCNSNKDCSTNAYCGVDHECHQYPQNLVVTKNNFLPASIVFGISIIIATFIFKRKN